MHLHEALPAAEPFTCEVCRQGFANAQNLRRHTREQHGAAEEKEPFETLLTYIVLWGHVSS